MTDAVLDAAGTLRLHRRLPGTPEAAFAAWTDPLWLARWMTPVGTATAEVDLRVGGRFRVVMEGEGRSIEHTGEYLEVDRPRRVRFTWVSPYTGPDPSVVTVRFATVAGGTEMVLEHSQLPTGGAASHAGGWGRMIERLADALRAATGT